MPEEKIVEARDAVGNTATTSTVVTPAAQPPYGLDDHQAGAVYSEPCADARRS